MQYMVMEMKTFIGLTSVQSRQQGIQSIERHESAENLQIADGIPYARRKYLGNECDPLIPRLNVQAVFRTLLLRGRQVSGGGTNRIR